MVWALGCPCVHSGQGGMMIRQAWWGRDAPSCNFFSLVCSENIAPMPPASVSLMTEFWPIGSGSSMWVIFLKNTQYLPALPYIKKCWQCLFSMAWPKKKGTCMLFVFQSQERMNNRRDENSLCKTLKGQGSKVCVTWDLLLWDLCNIGIGWYNAQ